MDGIEPSKTDSGESNDFAPLAQRIEQQPSKLLVAGSIPARRASDGVLQPPIIADVNVEIQHE